MSDELNQDADTITSEEELDLDLNLDDSEDVETLKDALAKKDAFARQVVARAKKAEAELKALKNTPAPQKEIITNNNPVNQDVIEETILRSQGLSDELLGELKALAKVRGTSLLATQADPIFVKMKEVKEEEAKAEKAKLSASRGSGQTKKTKDFGSQGLSDEEHKALWREKQGL